MRNFAQLPILQKKALAKTLTLQSQMALELNGHKKCALWSHSESLCRLGTSQMNKTKLRVLINDSGWRPRCNYASFTGKVLQRKTFRDRLKITVYMLVIDGVVFQLQERWRANFSPDQNEDEFVGLSRSSSQQSYGASAKQSVCLFHHDRQIVGRCSSTANPALLAEVL